MQENEKRNQNKKKGKSHTKQCHHKIWDMSNGNDLKKNLCPTLHIPDV